MHVERKISCYTENISLVIFDNTVRHIGQPDICIVRKISGFLDISGSAKQKA